MNKTIANSHTDLKTWEVPHNKTFAASRRLIRSSRKSARPIKEMFAKATNAWACQC